MHIKTSVKKITLAGLLIALSFVGSGLKIMGTIAFDSMPAFLGSLLLGPFYGAAIGFLGHMFTSLLSGFPFGLLIHLVVAFSMALTMVGFAVTFIFFKDKFKPQINYVVTGSVGTLLNGPVSLALSYPFLVPIMGNAGVVAMLPVLTLAAVANIAAAIIVYISIGKFWSDFI